MTRAARMLTGFAAAALLAVPAKAGAQECAPRGAATILTVAGAADANRDASGPLDRFSGHQELEFARARTFAADDLAALPQQVVAMVLPYDKQRHTFSGPSLQAVLERAGAAHAGAVAHGIDGYRMEFSSAELATLKPILAVCRDGRMLGVGDLGPAFVVFEPADGATPNDDEFARMIWGVYLVEPAP